MTTNPAAPATQLSGLGQGTWYMGENREKRAEEIRALQAGIDLGLKIIDTAEMYGNGLSEKLVGEAIEGRRNDVFLISKVLPNNASRKGTKTACERSLKRLGTDTIDLYLLHWQGPYSFADTIAGMVELVAEGKIRSWGVSNMDVEEMEEIVEAPHGQTCSANEILYNLSRRGVEYDLLPWSRDRNMPVIAYSPIEQSRILDDKVLADIAEKHGASPAQIALAWVIRNPGILAIPKAGTEKHVKENAAALSIRLNSDDLKALDRRFPPPTRKVALEML